MPCYRTALLRRFNSQLNYNCPVSLKVFCATGPWNGYAKPRLATAAYSAMRGDFGEDMAKLFSHTEHNHPTRQQSIGLFSLPFRRTDRGQRGFAYCGPNVLNSYMYTSVLNELPTTKKQFAKAVRRRIAPQFYWLRTHCGAFKPLWWTTMFCFILLAFYVICITRSSYKYKKIYKIYKWHETFIDLISENDYPETFENVLKFRNSNSL